MKLPEYYLTRGELEIFSKHRPTDIFEAFEAGETGFDLIEFGAGDGTKTAVLIDYFLKQNVEFSIPDRYFVRKRWIF